MGGGGVEPRSRNGSALALVGPVSIYCDWVRGRDNYKVTGLTRPRNSPKGKAGEGGGG